MSTGRPPAAARVSPCRTPVVIVGDDLDDDGLITLMLDSPVSHLVRDARDKDLRITSAKLASGDLFGIEKYVGGRVGERQVSDDAAKPHALAEVTTWAETTGARRPRCTASVHVVDDSCDAPARRPRCAVGL